MDESEQVRQSACLCLPPLCKRIINMEDRRSYAARAFDTLINSGNIVQYTALEILGEIVHLFHDDPLGPPQELLDVYFHQSDILDTMGGEDVRQFNDPDRAVVSAFNVSLYRTTFAVSDAFIASRYMPSSRQKSVARSATHL